MSVENLQVVKPLILVTPRRAKVLEIPTDRPVFIGLDSRVALFNPPYLLYQAGEVVGEVVDAPEGQKNRGFVDMKTGVACESRGEFADKPYTGFIAVGETIDNYKVEPISKYPKYKYEEGICVAFDRMHVTEIKAYIEDAEAEQGHLIRKVIHDFFFIPIGSERFTFEVKHGQVVFSEFDYYPGVYSYPERYMKFRSTF